MEATRADWPFAGATPTGRKGSIAGEPPLPIQGAVEVDMPVERLWDAFTDVSGWSRWNPCFRWSRVLGGELRLGATLVWTFNPTSKPPGLTNRRKEATCSRPRPSRAMT